MFAVITSGHALPPTPKGSMLPPLNPRQRQVVDLRSQGHVVVLGTAGTGKSLMAVVRAVTLSRDGAAMLGGEPSPVLLVTFANSLVNYLDHLTREASSRIDPVNVTTSTFHKAAMGYLKARGITGRSCDPKTRDALIAKATAVVSKTRTNLSDRPMRFFREEFDWIGGNGVRTLSEYLRIERTGRGTALGQPQRETVWAARDEYLRYRQARGLDLDLSLVGCAVRDQLPHDPNDRPWQHIVIDEGQDLQPEEIRALVNMVRPDGSITFFGDYAQQMYGSHLSWRSCGINLGNRRVERFADNFRNSTPIARLAVAVAKHPTFAGTEDELVEPVEPKREGGLPIVLRQANFDAELERVAKAARARGNRESVVVLAHTKRQVELIKESLPEARHLKDKAIWTHRTGIWCGTYHSAKGLEFDTVIMPLWGEGNVRVGVGTSEEDELTSRELKKLYVGITRARTRLLVTYSGKLSPLFPADESLYRRVGAD
ncbi:hypothetical protein STSO111631_15320 [Stackebrandtia soli]